MLSKSEAINENSYKVICTFKVDSIDGNDPFSVFVKINKESLIKNDKESIQFFFAGFIDFPVAELIKNKEIERISEDYFVSFPLSIPFTHHAMQSASASQLITSSSLEESLKEANIGYEAADKGIILHITADSVSNFKQKTSIVLYSLPEGSSFKKRENTEKQICIAKELSKCIEKILQSMIMESELSIEKKRLIVFKAEIDDLLSSFLW